MLKTIIILPLLLWALILPKISVVLLEFHPNVETVVICTGTEMIAITIGPDGNPIEIDDYEDAPCVVTEQDMVLAATTPDWLTLPRDYETAFIATPNLQNHHNPNLLNRSSQGPPLV